MTAKGIILIADDTPVNLKLLAGALAADGYEVVQAVNGERALASVADRRPELILLDIRMPGMDGFAVCRQLRARAESRDIPIIFISATDESAERVEGLKLGAVDFITKPFQREELLARVQTHLELGRLRDRLEQQAEGLRQANEQLQREIVERKQAEDTVRRSETKFRTLYDSTSDAVMLLDEKGFFDCNQATLVMFGCATREEFCSKHPADVSPPTQPGGADSRTLANHCIATAMEKGIHHFEWMHWRADTGESFPADVLLSAMELDGKPALQAVVRNITKRRRMEAERDQLIQDLKNALANVKSLSGLLPICASCKKIRDDQGYWSQVENYIQKHSEAKFSHGMCPDCLKKWYPELKPDDLADSATGTPGL